MEKEIIDVEFVDEQSAATAIQLASPDARGQLAKQAFDALPLERRHSDNLQILKQTCNSDPLAFLGLCRENGLNIDLSIVYAPVTNNNYITHHYGADSGLTRGDLIAFVQSIQPQQSGLSAEEILALVQASQPQYQPQQSGLSAEDVWAMMTAQQEQQQAYNAMLLEQMRYSQQAAPPPVYNVDISPRIEVSSNSEQDNNPAGGIFFFACLLVIFGVYGLALGGGD